MEKQNVILTVLGRKGMGKTTLVKEVIDEHARVLVLDTNGEYGDAVRESYDNIPDVADRLVAQSQADHEAIAEGKTLPAFSIAYTPDEIPEDGYKFLELAWEFIDVLVVVDETPMYVQTHSLPKPISRLVRLGRHRRIDQVYVAQRAATIHRDITAQSDCVVSFGQHEGRDIEYMKGMFGQDAEHLRELLKYRVVLYGDAEKAPLCVHSRTEKKEIDPQIKLL